MPTAIETIRSRAIEKTGLPSLPWADGLSQLNKAILSKDTSLPPEAQKLVNGVARGLFILAFVTNETYTKFDVFPLVGLPAEVALNGRNHTAFNEPENLPDLQLDAKLILTKCTIDELLNSVPDVVLLSQNPQPKKKHQLIERSPIIVTRMDKRPVYPQKDQYMDWIQRIKDELNGVKSDW